MTTIQKDEYVFSVDVEKTKEYYKTHTLCDCVCCRGFEKILQADIPFILEIIHVHTVGTAFLPGDRGGGSGVGKGRPGGRGRWTPLSAE